MNKKWWICLLIIIPLISFGIFKYNEYLRWKQSQPTFKEIAEWTAEYQKGISKADLEKFFNNNKEIINKCKELGDKNYGLYSLFLQRLDEISKQKQPDFNDFKNLENLLKTVKLEIKFEEANNEKK